MSLFKSPTHQDIWIEANCEVSRCWRYGSCPILASALRRDRKPPQWKRNPRPKVIAEQYKCSEQARRRPAPPQRQIDVPMFDVEPVVHHQESDHA